MSEIEADLDQAAAAYWMNVARKGGPQRSVALNQASELLRDARAESRIPDSAVQPTLNELQAPPLDVPKARRMIR